MKNTEQENFWFGTLLVMNTSKEIKAMNLQKGRNYQYINQFSKIFLNNRIIINSAIEIGANIGINLDSLKILFPKCKTFRLR